MISLPVIIGTKDLAVDLGSLLSGSTRLLKRQRNLATISSVVLLRPQKMLGSSSLEGRGDVTEDSDTSMALTFDSVCMCVATT